MNSYCEEVREVFGKKFKFEFHPIGDKKYLFHFLGIIPNGRTSISTSSNAGFQTRGQINPEIKERKNIEECATKAMQLLEEVKRNNPTSSVENIKRLWYKKIEEDEFISSNSPGQARSPLFVPKLAVFKGSLHSKLNFTNLALFYACNIFSSFIDYDSPTNAMSVFLNNLENKSIFPSSVIKGLRAYWLECEPDSSKDVHVIGRQAQK